MDIFPKKKIVSQNSRAHRRLRSFCLLKYTVLSDPTQKKIVVNPRDISAGGVLFYSDRNLPKGSMLEVDIYLPPLKDFFTAMGNVVSAMKAKGENRYIIRLRFTAVDPEERKRINSYIEQLAKDPYMHRYLDRKPNKVKRRYLR